MKCNLKKGDQVRVIAGKDKGKTGKILNIVSKKDRALVEKINIIKRHTKPSQLTRQGGIIERESPIRLSNLMVVCEKCNAPVRIGKLILDDGSKVRVCRKCGEILDK